MSTAVPTGREAVASAVLDAAAELFAEKGPESTSIRDIAKNANVNHGLVFRHFGTKEQLVGAVLDHLGQQLADALAADAPAEALDAVMDRQSRVVARTLLDGYPAGTLQKSFPNVAPLLERVRPHHRGDREARVATANAIALQLGWRLFGPFLTSALELGDLTDAELREMVAAEVERLLQPRA